MAKQGKKWPQAPEGPIAAIRIGKANFTKIIDRGTEPNDTRNMGRASFKLVRRFVVSRFFKGNRTDHVASALIRGHFL